MALIVDDSSAILDALSGLLSPSRGFEVVGLGKDGVEAVEMAMVLLPEVVLSGVSGCVRRSGI